MIGAQEWPASGSGLDAGTWTRKRSTSSICINGKLHLRNSLNSTQTVTITNGRPRSRQIWLPLHPQYMSTHPTRSSLTSSISEKSTGTYRLPKCSLSTQIEIQDESRRVEGLPLALPLEVTGRACRVRPSVARLRRGEATSSRHEGICGFSTRYRMPKSPIQFDWLPQSQSSCPPSISHKLLTCRSKLRKPRISNYRSTASLFLIYTSSAPPYSNSDSNHYVAKFWWPACIICPGIVPNWMIRLSWASSLGDWQ